MDFLEDLFDFGDRKRRKDRGLFHDGDQHDDDYDEHHQPYPRTSSPNPSYPVSQSGPIPAPPGIVCPRCAAQLVQEAKFCHNCGANLAAVSNCPACGTKLAPNSAFCSQCGYKLK